MTEHPIIFSAPMVRAILAGTKTQKRRVVRTQPRGNEYAQYPNQHGGTHEGLTYFVCEYGDRWPQNGWSGYVEPCPYGVSGSLLWVKESFCLCPQDGVIYRATQEDAGILPPDDCIKWKPSIHMHRWASRITLQVTDVRVQRVQDITEEDARAEGCVPETNPDPGNTCRHNFRLLWDSINAKRGFAWNTNCWVWAISFDRVQPPLPVEGKPNLA